RHESHAMSTIYPYTTLFRSAIFKADEEETQEKYSISEWWLEPNTEGPGAHEHEENDEIFYVLEGVTTFLIGDKWIDAEKGTMLRDRKSTRLNSSHVKISYAV